MSKRPRDFSALEKPNLEPRAREGRTRKPRARPETLAPRPPPPHSPGEVPPRPPKAPSKLPLAVFGLVALLGLGASVAALVIHIRTGGQQTEFSEEILAQELVPVEPPAGPPSGGQPAPDENLTGEPSAEDDSIDLSAATPNLIALRGDPIIVQRRQSIARQQIRIDPARIGKASAIKAPGDIFRLSDNLGSAPLSLVSGAPGSQLGYAFSGADTGSDDADAPAQPGIGDDATLLPVSSAASDDDAAGPSRVVIAKPLAAETAVSDFLTSNGFDADLAKQLETQAIPLLGKPRLDAKYAVAAVGLRQQQGDQVTGYLPVQVAFFKEGQFVAALALNEADAYVPGANPWFGQNPFQGPDEVAGGSQQRLLDVIYGAAVRNNLPTTVAGEILMLLSRQFDLEQPATGDEVMQVLYVSKARDRKSGLGKVLYVRVDRGQGDALECFAFQPQPKKPFECVSSAGEGIASDGMTTPVRGVLDRKFGPGRDPVTRKKRMFYGVEWIAPPGTPVVAAYGGSVAFAGTDPELGLTVKLSHDGGQMTVYGHLKAIAANLTEGRGIRAGQRIGTVGAPEGGTDSRLYFELRRNGQAVDPFGDYQTKVEKGGAIEGFVYRITTIESGNNCRAKNPLSTAAGLGQFINSTWLRIIRDYRPDLVAGRSESQILDLRYDCAIALEMTTALTRENASYIRARGHTVTPGNLYLAHFLGPEGAAQALGASPATPVAAAFGSGVVKANPFLEGKDCAYLIEWAARKMAGKGKAPVIASPAGASPKAQSLASNRDFLQFRDAVLSLLN